MNYFNESGSFESEIKKTQEKTGFSSGAGVSGMNYSASSCMAGDYNAMPSMGCSMMPIYECPQERVCHRYICYDVPQV